eukprot:353769-Chlamydomonas_euryale.AAC.1
MCDKLFHQSIASRTLLGSLCGRSANMFNSFQHAAGRRDESSPSAAHRAPPTSHECACIIKKTFESTHCRQVCAWGPQRPLQNRVNGSK